MDWEDKLNKNLKPVKLKVKDLNNQGKIIRDPRRHINPNLVMDAFSPKSGWYTTGYIPATITVKNMGNAPSFNAIVAIYAGGTGRKLSEFECISTFKFTLYPDEKVKKDITIEQKKLPFSHPFSLPLPGSSRLVLIAICFDPFLNPLNKSLEITGVNEIENNDFIAGGYYQNDAIRQGDGAILFGYKKV